ncbi:uncharacterized protein LOC131067861 [Cryptomeria japonica]|uniref:uncharacterized protein LOC131067861 n=1 Tax=Cryptomeria japonica TaxID=3369 RepID=UPI0025AB8ECF|nr:uncharacterized protein LOC131067861 [Cryptomeria japonica]XP_057859020.1 uncharacterized protein LOC131067861 [Cryptomeria japonica]
MLINVGELWEKPIPIADDESIPSYSIEGSPSHEEYTYFKNFSAGISLGSDLAYGVRAMDFIKDLDEICPEKQINSHSAKTIDNHYAFSHGVSSESKGRKRAIGIQVTEDLSCAHTSKSMRVLSETKDRHSKVKTARGHRDTRVRLSLSTAFKFYDVQDRLGYKHPSKALDWLISKAQTAIDELPQPLYVSKTNCTVCNFISKTCSTSLATDQAISTSSHTNDGCSTNSSVDTSRSEEEGNEELLRSYALMNLGIPRLVSDPEVMSLSTR